MTSPATPDTDPVPASTAGTGSSRARLLVVLAVAVLGVMLVRAFLMQPYFVASESMSPTLSAGDRVLVAKVGSPAVGDLVVADVTEPWGGPDRATHTDDGLIGRVLGSASGALGIDLGEKSTLGRIIARGGDEVVCCDAGRVTVNGEAVGPELADAGEAFSLTVPNGRYFLLSDSAAHASDSRTHRTDSAGAAEGTVAEDAIIGRVVTRIWPLGKMGSPTTPETQP